LVVRKIIINRQVKADDELVLLHLASIETFVPSQWSTKLEKQWLQLVDVYERGGFRIKVSPDFPEMYQGIIVKQPAFFHLSIFKTLQDNGNEQVQKDHIDKQ
jgi:hypothetical protein